MKSLFAIHQKKDQVRKNNEFNHLIYIFNQLFSHLTQLVQHLVHSKGFIVRKYD